MTPKPDKIAELARLTRMVLESERNRMAPLLAEERRLKEAIERVKKSGWITVGPQAQVGLHIGADQAWARWSAAEVRKLSIALARARARRMEAEVRLRKSHGRNEAALALGEKAKAHEKTGARRESEANALQTLSLFWQTPG